MKQGVRTIRRLTPLRLRVVMAPFLPSLTLHQPLLCWGMAGPPSKNNSAQSTDQQAGFLLRRLAHSVHAHRAVRRSPPLCAARPGAPLCLSSHIPPPAADIDVRCRRRGRCECLSSWASQEGSCVYCTGHCGEAGPLALALRRPPARLRVASCARSVRAASSPPRPAPRAAAPHRQATVARKEMPARLDVPGLCLALTTRERQTRGGSGSGAGTAWF